MLQSTILIACIAGAILLFGFLAMLARWYKKVPQGKAIVRTGGTGGLKISFGGMIVVPVLHRWEVMDISLKRVEISREGKQGLICKDNLRADIRVAFFVRVNNNPEDVAKVAQTVGCERASDQELLFTLFEAKFSDALKTVGKQFDFVDLYNSRERFKKEIVNIIGVDLNGYILDDCAIDFLEQTPVDQLDPDNILDSEGIKKITELTANQKVQANLIRNDEIKRTKKQDVEAREAVLQLERQQAEAEEKQKREISIIKSREESAAEKVAQEEKLKAEQARIITEEQIKISEENMLRQIVVAQKNKEKTEVLEQEKIDREHKLAITEKERVVELAQIAKEKNLEEERKNIQDVIRERIMVQKAVVAEEEKIKDTQAFAEANRLKSVAITAAEQRAEEALVEKMKGAEAAKEAAKLQAEQLQIEAEAQLSASSKQAESKKIMADARATEIASEGMAEAQILEAKAKAHEKEGEAKAAIIESQAEAEAKGIQLKAASQSKANQQMGEVEVELLEKRMKAEAAGISAKAVAEQERGLAEAAVQEKKALVEAERIKAEAEALKHMDEAARHMEQFKLQLNMNREIELASIQATRELAQAQAQVLSEAMKTAKIEILGGDPAIFDRIVGSIARGKAIDGMVNKSEVLTELKNGLIGNGEGNLIERLKELIDKVGLKSEDVRNLSVANLLNKMSSSAADTATQQTVTDLLKKATSIGIADQTLESLGFKI